MPLETKTEGSGTGGSATADFGLDPAPGCGRASGENKSTHAIATRQGAEPDGPHFRLVSLAHSNGAMPWGHHRRSKVEATGSGGVGSKSNTKNAYFCHTQVQR